MLRRKSKEKKEKFFCPTCGAKNDVGVDRCRVCTSFITMPHSSPAPASGEAAAGEPAVGTWEAAEVEWSLGSKPDTVAEPTVEETFDPNALVIGEPALPRPSTEE